jgi:hypothetical protein
LAPLSELLLAQVLDKASVAWLVALWAPWLGDLWVLVWDGGLVPLSVAQLVAESVSGLVLLLDWESVCLSVAK